MVKIILCGALGRMGRAVASAAETKGGEYKIVYGIDINSSPEKTASCGFPVVSCINDITSEGDEVIVDFSNHEMCRTLCDFSVKYNLPLIICSTGMTGDEIAYINETSEKTAVFRSGNMSLGINVLCELVKRAAESLRESFDIEIVESHHRMKLDAPSGTALMLADAARAGRGEDMEYIYDRHDRRAKRPQSEIGISSVRGGSIVGEHEVIFAGSHELVKLTHQADSREVFAVGALFAASFMKGKPKGLYSMSDVISSAL
ncbi:MAG: 4-hydroxy-tetrahydrodipicolinate reductase [Eubacteriales bacterium]|jgi:4-hydroxy-tetrahydrodipicolinate reductase